MPVMFGKGQPTTFHVKTNFGSNMPIWSSLLESISKQEMFSPGGWSGFPDKEHG